MLWSAGQDVGSASRPGLGTPWSGDGAPVGPPGGPCGFLTRPEPAPNIRFMVAAHDQLFCKLGIRAGHLDRETAIELLRRYREEARRGRPIAEFAVAEEFVDQDTADAIEEIISHRASGHVSEKRRPAHKVTAPAEAGDGHHPPGRRHQHHTPAQARTVKSNPAQVALIGIAMLVLVVVVIVLVMQLYESDAKTSDELIQEGRRNRATTKEKSNLDDKVVKLADPDIEKGKRQYTPEEIEHLKKLTRQAKSDARMARSDGNPYRALRIMENTRERMGGDKLPEQILGDLAKEIGVLHLAIEATYRDLMVSLQKAKSDDDAVDVENLLSDIKDQCGPDFLTSAKKEIGM